MSPTTRVLSIRVCACVSMRYDQDIRRELVDMNTQFLQAWCSLLTVLELTPPLYFTVSQISPNGVRPRPRSRENTQEQRSKINRTEGRYLEMSSGLRCLCEKSGTGSMSFTHRTHNWIVYLMLMNITGWGLLLVYVATQPPSALLRMQSQITAERDCFLRKR